MTFFKPFLMSFFAFTFKNQIKSSHFFIPILVLFVLLRLFQLYQLCPFDAILLFLLIIFFDNTLSPFIRLLAFFKELAQPFDMFSFFDLFDDLEFSLSFSYEIIVFQRIGSIIISLHYPDTLMWVS